MKGLGKFLLFFSIVLLSVSVFHSCGQAPTEEITMTICYWGSPAEDTAIEAALDAFEKANSGIKAVPMYIPGDISGVEYASKMRALAQANQLPD
ncbi:MAG: hypothetical protein EHM28_08015 [Spirochaetaceae bacterium]|nr:MAG: hypothetical protein EHM28_08015 [Spirochaetaceae bacterium]